MESPMARSRRAADHFRAISRAAGLVLQLLPNTTEREEFEGLQKKLEADFNALVMHQGDALARAVAPLEVGLAKLETKFQAIDALIPMSWFRERFDLTQASSVAVADYAATLGRHAGEDAARLDRIQYLLTRLVSFFVTPENDAPGLRRQLLTDALPPTALDARVRETAVAFCRDAALRLRTFATLKELFDSGFFVDVRGYKLSLRQQLLDPDVMTAVIELNEATTATIDRLATAEKTAGKDLALHLSEVDQRVKAIFARARGDETKRTETLEAWLKRVQEARKKGERPPRHEEFKPLRTLTVHERQLILGGFALLLVLVLIFRMPNGQRIKELTAAECTAASPIVESCAVAPADKPRVFIGQVDKARWVLLGQGERRDAASQLALEVSQRGWVAGTVMFEGRVVMQVENGQVLVVQ